LKIREFTRSGSQSDEITEREQRNRILARAAAEEGLVLLKNDGILPLNVGDPLALLGAGAALTIKGGMGSGDVNVRHSVSLYDGLDMAGVHITSKAWIEDYLYRYDMARQAWKKEIISEAGDINDARFFDVYSRHPFKMPEGREIEDVDIANAETAVYVIARTAGEGSDRHLEKGDYYLTDNEVHDLTVIASFVKNIVVVLNIGAPMDVSVLNEIPEVRAILLMSQGGEEGGNACARALVGYVTPSGKLTDTWAKNYKDYPCAMEFGALDGDVSKALYRDGIYVGYRYFDSFGVAPQYHFGYGLSYTKFSVSAMPPLAGPDGLYIQVSVTNVGDTYSGKEVVEIYAACPQPGTDGASDTSVNKEYKRLVAFAKTKLLAPGETQDMTIHVENKNLASFHEDYEGDKGAWVIERGDYAIFAGDTSEDKYLKLAGVVQVLSDHVLELVPKICKLQESLDEIAAPIEVIKDKTESWKNLWTTLKRAREQGKDLGIDYGNRKDIEFLNAMKGSAVQEETIRAEWKPGINKSLDKTVFEPGQEPTFTYKQDDIDRMAHAIADALEVKDLMPLLMGELSSYAEALGSTGDRVPGAAGETSGALEEIIHMPGISMADGPAGLRLTKEYHVDRSTGKVHDVGIAANIENGFFLPELEHRERYDTWYQFPTAWPVGVCLAQTWNLDIVSDVGKATAVEMDEYNISWWLAPGLNIHRNPMCGRNFEYYAEDPLISGKMAAAITLGVQSRPGVGTTIKHFACNNQEDNRMGCDSVISERTLREIYLRGFEIAIKDSQPMCIMTSYNLINGVHSANCYDICTEVARKEWNFKGVIMTDWTTTMPHGGSDSAGCISAGNDLIMPGYDGDLRNISEALDSGRLSEKDVRACAERIINIVLRTNGYEDAKSYYDRFM